MQHIGKYRKLGVKLTYLPTGDIRYEHIVLTGTFTKGNTPTRQEVLDDIRWRRHNKTTGWQHTLLKQGIVSADTDFTAEFADETYQVVSDDRAVELCFEFYDELHSQRQ